MPLEELPDGTHFTDVLEASQAAWLARDYTLARDLIQRYVDPDGEFCCMRCCAMENEPWKVKNHLGTFYVCESCTAVISRAGELLSGGGELFFEGPLQKATQFARHHYDIGRGMTLVTATATSQKRIHVSTRPK